MHKVATLSGVKAGPQDGLAEGEFTAYASVFDVKDSYGDVVRKGAFADTLAVWFSKEGGRALPLLYGHNLSDPDLNIGEIVAATEDDHGLKVHGRFDLEGGKGAQVYRLVKGRRVSELSFAYDIIEGGPAKSAEFGDYYELTKLKLYEVSIVPIGANPETEILAVKHLADAVKAGRVLSAKNETALRGAYEAIGSVLDSLPSEDEKKSAPSGGEVQEQASGSEPVTQDEGPDGAKSSEPMRDPSVYLALTQAAMAEFVTAGKES